MSPFNHSHNQHSKAQTKPISKLASKISLDMFGASSDLPRIIELDVAQVVANPNQPRKFFDEAALHELADSIEMNGLLQPILVKGVGDEFEIVAGERRYRAHLILGRQTIAAIVATGNAAEIAIVENIQRADLMPLELAESLARLMESHAYTQETVAKVIGKARSTVAELLTLNHLPESIKADCRTSDNLQPSKSFLIELVKLDGVAQAAAWEKFKAGDTSLKTVKAARQGKNEVAMGAATDVLVTRKPKRVFHTQHQATVIVQADGESLSDEQARGALLEAVERMILL